MKEMFENGHSEVNSIFSVAFLPAIVIGAWLGSWSFVVRTLPSEKAASLILILVMLTTTTGFGFIGGAAMNMLYGQHLVRNWALYYCAYLTIIISALLVSFAFCEGLRKIITTKMNVRTHKR